MAMLERLRDRTNGYTITPAQYTRVAQIALGALTLIVMTGAAVRLTGSGLGCPDWPRCYGNAYPPLNSHAIIEFSNRMITFPVSIAAIAAWVLAYRRRPYRRDLMWIALLLPLGVVGQAILGGFTVRGALDYGWVMGHFALSMMILAAASLLAWRAAREPGPSASELGDRTVSRLAWIVAALGGVAIVAGTAATAAGPHAGGSPGQRINRLAFDGRGTMDFVIHRHAEIAAVFGLCALALWWLARRRSEDPVLRRSTTVLCALLALQGAVGLLQYETQLPTELVWLHVTLSCLIWIAALWSAFAAGLPARRAVPAGPEEQRALATAGVSAVGR